MVERIRSDERAMAAPRPEPYVMPHHEPGIAQIMKNVLVSRPAIRPMVDLFGRH